MPLRGTPSVATAPPAVDVATRTPPPDPASLQPSAAHSGAPMNADAVAVRGPENSAAATAAATAGLTNATGDKDQNQSTTGAGGPAQPLAHAEDATTTAAAVAVGHTAGVGAGQDAADAEEEEFEEYYEETYEEDADGAGAADHGAGADVSNAGQQPGPGQRGPKQQLKQLSFEEAAQRHEAAHTGGGSGVARLPSDRSKRSALRATSSECPARVQRKVAAPTSVVVKGYRYDPYTSPSGKELWDDDEEEIAQQPSPGNGQLRGTPIARIRPPERWGIPGKHPHGAPTNMPPLGADVQPAQSDEHLQYAQHQNNNNQPPQPPHPHGFQQGGQGGQPHGAQPTAQQYGVGVGGDESPYDNNVNAPIGHGGQQGGMYQGDQQHPQHGQGYPPQGGQGQYVPGGTPPPSPPMHGQYHQGAPAPVAPPSPSAQHLQHFPAQHHQPPHHQSQHPQPHHGGGQQGQQGQQQGGGGQPIAPTGALQQQQQPQHHHQQQPPQQSQQPDLAALWCFLPPPPVRATTLQEMLDNGIEDEEAEQAVTSMSTRWFVHLKRKTKDLAADLDALDVTTVSQAQVPRLTSLRGLVAALNSVGDCPAPDFKKVSCARWAARCHQWWSRLSTGFAEARHGQTAAGRAPAVARPEAEDEREVLRQEREAAEVKAKTDRRNQRELERLERKETERRAKYEALEGERWVKKRDAIAAVLSELRANDTSSSPSHHGPSSAAAGHSSAVVASMPAQHQEERHEPAQPQEGHADQHPGSSSSSPTNKVRVTPPPPHQQKFVETFSDRKVLQRVALPGFGDDTATETVLTLPTTASSATASSDNTFPTTTDPAISGKLVIPPFNGNMVFAAPPPPNTRVMRKNALLDDPTGPGLKPPTNPRGNNRGGGNRDRCGGAGGGAFTAPQPETPARDSITAAENGAIAMLAYRWFTRVSEVQVQWLPEFDHTGVRCHCPTLPQVREEFLKKALKSKSTSKSAKSATVAAAALACVSDTASLASLAEGPGSALGIDLENVPQNVLDDIVDTWMDVCHAWWKEHFSLGGRRGAAAAVATTVKISVGAGNKGETVDPALFKPKPRGKGGNNGGGGGGNNGRNAGPPRHNGGGGHNPAGGYHQPPPPAAHHANVPEQQAGHDHQHQVGGHAPPPHPQAQPQYYYAPHPHYAQGQAPPVSYPPGPYYAQPPQPMYYQQGGYPPTAAPAPTAAPGAAAPHAQYQQHEQQDHHGGGGGRGEDRRRSSRQDSRRGHGGYDDQNAAAAAAAAAAPSPSAAQYAYPEQQYPQAAYYGGAPGGYAAAAAPPPHHQQPAHGYYQ